MERIRIRGFQRREEERRRVSKKRGREEAEARERKIYIAGDWFNRFF